MNPISSQAARASVATHGNHRPAPLCAAILFALGSAPGIASAATIVVTDAGDTDVTAANTCTLRQAILSMNNSSVSGDCVNSGDAFGSNDTVNFAAGVNDIELADVDNTALHVTASSLKVDAGAGRMVTVRRHQTFTDGRNQYGLGYTGRGLFFADQGSSGSLSLIGLKLTDGRGAHQVDFPRPPTFGLSIKYTPSFMAGGAVQASGNLWLDRCVVAHNGTEAGGAVAVAGALTMTNCQLYDNRTFRHGGAIVAPSAFILDSSITGNHATTGPSVGEFAALTMFDTTVSGNVANNGTLRIGTMPKSDYEAAHYIPPDPASGARIYHSTIACNSGTYAAITNTRGLPMRLESSIVSNTQGAVCAGFSPADIDEGDADRWYQFNLAVSGHHNFVGKIGSAKVTFADAQPSTDDPQLLPLGNNGGSTLTHSPAPGSPAIDAGGMLQESPYDQRGAGFPRVVGPASDIGAFESGTPLDGSCGSANGTALASLIVTTPGLCAVGSPLQISGAGPWDWQCGDVSAGVRASCHARIAVTPTFVFDRASVTWPYAGIPAFPYKWGEPATLELSVNGNAPQGTVDFYIDKVQGTPPSLTFVRDHIACAGVAVAAGKAHCPVDTTTMANPNSGWLYFTYEAVFTSSDSEYVSSDVGAITVLEIDPVGSTTTVVSADPGTTVVGQPFAVSAQVTANSPSAGTPAGTITISDVTDGTSCTAAAGSSPGACTLAATTAGTKTLHASFGGTKSAYSSLLVLRTSQSADVSWIVNPASTTTTLAPDPIAFGASATLAATLAVVAPGAGTPTGTITITDTTDGLSCSYAADAPTPGCSIQPPSAGTKALTAHYTGDDNFLASDATGTLEVTAAASGAVLASSANPSNYGAAVTLTATITPTAGNPVSTGFVDFADGATSLCTGVALAAAGGNASASCTTSALSGGTHALTASYAGDANTQASQAALTQTVNPAASSVSLASSANPSTQGQAVTFTASVTAAAAAQAATLAAAKANATPAAVADDATPTGTVSFTNDGAVLVVVPVSGGAASVTTTALTTGTHTIAANYSGDTNHAPVSFAITQTIAAQAVIADTVPAPLSRTLLAALAALVTAIGTLALGRRGVRLD